MARTRHIVAVISLAVLLVAGMAFLASTDTAQAQQDRITYPTA